MSGAPSSDPTEYDQPSFALGDYRREELQRLAAQRQELYRLRVAIPHATGENVATNLAAGHIWKMTGSPLPVAPPARPYQDLLLGGLLVLAGILTVRKYGPEISEGINFRFNPIEPANTALREEKIREEEEAFAEFLIAFQAGPPPKPADPPSAAGSPVAKTSEAAIRTDSRADREAIKEFQVRAAKLLATQRTILDELNRSSDEAGRQKLVSALRWEMHVLKDEAGHPELLPAWQVACALEGLLDQLSRRAGNLTHSTLRTVAGGVELLEDLCRSGVKASLFASPPLRFLAVDDDSICRKAIALALKKAFNQPDLAENGEAAIALAEAQAYDAVFLDVQMPGMDGFELCSRIHKTNLNPATPVVFVTCQSDFDARAKSVLSGGSDLIGKPFLTFEITVKALTFALRGRLPARAPISLEKTNPAAEKVASPRTAPSMTGATKTIPSPGPKPAAPQPPPIPTSAVPPELVPAELIPEFLARVSAHLDPLRALIATALQTSNEAEWTEMLADTFLRIHSFGASAKLAKLHPGIQMSAALEGLLRKLLEHPKHCTLSTLHSIATAVDLLQDMYLFGVRADMATHPPIRMLVVDDDPVARRALVGALQMAFEKPESSEGGEAAIAAAREKPFDLIFLDVEMPGLDGFAVCAGIRQTVPNRDTPVVFVTGHSDFKARALSTASGGSDLVSKPFLTAEITVKALTFALRGRLQRLEAAAA